VRAGAVEECCLGDGEQTVRPARARVRRIGRPSKVTHACRVVDDIALIRAPVVSPGVGVKPSADTLIG